MPQELAVLHVPEAVFPPPEASMPSRASPFSRVGAGAAYSIVSLVASIEYSTSQIDLTLLLRSMEESSPTPWTWLPALVSTTLSDSVPLRGMIADVEWVF